MTLKEHFVKLGIADAHNWRREVCDKMKWTEDKWYNKLHGKTPLTEIEIERFRENYGLELKNEEKPKRARRRPYENLDNQKLSA